MIDQFHSILYVEKINIKITKVKLEKVQFLCYLTVVIDFFFSIPWELLLSEA